MKNAKQPTQPKGSARETAANDDEPVRREMPRQAPPRTARAQEVRRIFQKLYRAPTRDSVLIFYQWLENNRQDLLSQGDDSYPYILADVQDLLVQPPAAREKQKRSR
jgi:hypothetical protein